MIDLPKLPDVLAPNLRVVFCRTAAGTQSALKQAYYAGQGNRFWRVVRELELTDAEIPAVDYRETLSYGIGLTDVCKFHAGMDKELPSGAFAPDELEAKIAKLKPHAIAFNGKKAAQIALGFRSTAELDYGRHPVSFGGAVALVLPSTSGAASGHWNIAPWRKLATTLPARSDVSRRS
jgi:double-stranded uracil-DNA glycosylase